MSFSNEVISRYREQAEKYKTHKRLQDRIALNLCHESLDLSREKFWRSLLLGVITSMKKASAIEKAKALPIFDYRKVCREKDKLDFFREQLSHVGRQKRSSIQLVSNFQKMENQWEELEEMLISLKDGTTLEKERKAALLLQKFDGIGPKQSRNILQMLGLSRYVIPIDSRIIETVRTLGGIDIPDIARPLSREPAYRHIEDQLNELAKALDLEPCVLEVSLYRPD